MEPLLKGSEILEDTEIAPLEGLTERLYWLIRLRWFAVAGVPLTALVADKASIVPLDYAPLYYIAAAIGVYNGLFLLYLNRARASARLDLPRPFGCETEARDHAPAPIGESIGPKERGLPVITNRLTNAHRKIESRF